METCFDRWGIAKTTIDDIAEESGISRASIYRMYPGGRAALVEAFRTHRRGETAIMLFRAVKRYRAKADQPTLGGLLACIVSVVAQGMGAAGELAEMQTFAPETAAGVTGRASFALEQMTENLAPLLHDFVPPPEARRLINLSIRLLYSYRIAPCDGVDLRKSEDAFNMIVQLIPEAAHTLEASTKD